MRRWTEVQAAGVEKLLATAGRLAVVRAAMNCSNPLVEDVVRDLGERGVRRFLAFPLYPHYSLTTTKGALERSSAAVGGWSFRVWGPGRRPPPSLPRTRKRSARRSLGSRIPGRRASICSIRRTP